MLKVPRFDPVVEDVSIMYNWGEVFRGSVIQIAILTPALGGEGVVAKGFVLTTGAS